MCVGVPFRRIALGALALALAAGCGKAPETTPRLPRSTPRPVPTVTIQPPALNPDAGTQLLMKVKAAFMTCTGAQAEVKAYSEGHFKAGAKVTELRKSNYHTKMLWVKPQKIRGDIVATDNFLVGGAKMATLDGKKVKVRAGGVLGILPLTLSVDDDMLSSNRHHTFAEQLPNRLCERLMGETASWKVLGEGQVQGVPVTFVEVLGVPRLDKEITREVVAVDPAGATLRGVTMYAGETKVVDVKFMSFRWNPKPAADAFDI